MPQREFLPLRAARWTTRRLLSENHRFLTYYRILSTRGLGDLYIRARAPLRSALITSDTQLVVDGFPRSANSLVRVMLEQLHDEPISVSTHLHTPRAIERAIELGIPRLVLLRDPDDAVASLVQLQPGLTPDVAFRVYADYYRRLIPYVSQFTLGHFPQVVSDFPSVVRAVNQMFETHFTEKRPDIDTRSAETFARIDNRADLFEHRGSSDHVVARPSAERKDTTSVIRGLSQRDRAFQSQARIVYEALLDAANQSS